MKSMLNAKPEKAGKKRGEADEKDMGKIASPAAKSVGKVVAESKDRTSKLKPSSSKPDKGGIKHGRPVEAKARKLSAVQRKSKRTKEYAEELKSIELARNEIVIEQNLVTEPGDLPVLYGDPRIVLMPVDAHLANVYWEIDDADFERVRKKLARKFGHLSPVLRFFDITDLLFDGSTARGFFDIDIDLRTGNWYVYLPGPGKIYFVDLGIKTEGGIFFPIIRSNATQTPQELPEPGEAGEYVFVSRDEASRTVIHASGGRKQEFSTELKSRPKQAKYNQKGHQPRGAKSPSTGLPQGKIAGSTRPRKPLVYPKPVRIEGMSSVLSVSDDFEESDITDISEKGFVQGISSGSFTSR